jgi:deoxyribonuclease V
MHIPNLHPWNYSPTEAVRLQQELAEQVRLQPPPGKTYRLIAGADVSATRASRFLWAAVIVLRLPDFEVVEEAFARQEAGFPYVPGLLSFREIPAVVAAMRQLSCLPDAVLCDGQGLAHPRFLGLACHLGLWLNLPTIGCAKTRLVGKAEEPGALVGSRSPLHYQDRIVGSVLRTRAGSRPLFVSPGHLMDLDLAVEITLSCCRRGRLPEPTRLAHLAVNRFRQQT